MLKEFIPYQEAIEMKQLGFDEPCFGYYVEIDKWIPASYSKEGIMYPSNKDLLSNWVSSPLYQQAFKWFRDKYDLHYKMVPTIKGKYASYTSQIGWTYIDMNKSYEESELACLRKLIEIVKQKP